MKPFTALSLDDEPSAHRVLQRLIDALPELVLTACCTEPDEAARLLDRGGVDLLFLDVAMPKISGLDFLRSLPHPPVTVLITAHGSYAMDAFQLGVRDYLLKPVSPQRLRRCLDHVMPLLGGGNGGARLAVKQGSGHFLFNPDEISHIEAAGNFSMIHVGDDEVLVSEPLKDLEERLAPFGFIRVHKSHLVNSAGVIRLQPGYVCMRDGRKAPLGRMYKHALADLMSDDNC